MKNKPYEILCELLDNPENLSIDKLDLLVKNSLKFFNEYIEICKSNDEEKKKEVLEQLLSLKEKLEEIAKKTSETTGLSTDQLIGIMSDPSNFSKDEWAAIKDLQNSVTDFNTSLLKETFAKKEDFRKTKKGLKKHRMSV